MSKQLRIKNRIIETPIIDILKIIRNQNGRLFFHDLREKTDNIMCTCPYHANGQERKPSATIFIGDDDRTELGMLHCFSCGETHPFIETVAFTMGMDVDEASDWLCTSFGTILLESPIEFPDDILGEKPEITHFYDPAILQRYAYYHPYMQQRKLEQKTIDHFCIGYSPEEENITFPVWDIKNNLVMITKRNVNTKRFEIPANIEKPVYLLNYVLHYQFPICIITESQIDALTAWQYGFPAVATMGSISDNAMKTLNKCGITNFITMFDNDNAGINFTNIFNSKIRKDAMVINIKIPSPYKDINDLSPEIFNHLLSQYDITQRLSINFDNLVEN